MASYAKYVMERQDLEKELLNDIGENMCYVSNCCCVGFGYTPTQIKTIIHSYLELGTLIEEKGWRLPN